MSGEAAERTMYQICVIGFFRRSCGRTRALLGSVDFTSADPHIECVRATLDKMARAATGALAVDFAFYAPRNSHGPRIDPLVMPAE